LAGKSAANFTELKVSKPTDLTDKSVGLADLSPIFPIFDSKMK